MRRFILSIFSLAAVTFFMQAQDTDGNPPAEIVKYYFVELITNPDRPELPKHQVDSIQSAHMANMGKMVEDEVLVLAGPFESGGGIFVLKVDTLEEAQKLAAKDPAVSAGRLLTKIRAWYTAADAFTIEQKFKKNQPKN